MLIRDFNRDIALMLIRRGFLTIEEAAAAIGLSRQVKNRWDDGQIPKSEEVEILLKAAGCSNVEFAEFACEWLTEHTGVHIAVDPKQQARYLPTVPLAGASHRFREHLDELGRQQRDLIEEKLQQARLFEAAAEQMVAFTARDVHREIDRALAAKRKVH